MDDEERCPCGRKLAGDQGSCRVLIVSVSRCTYDPVTQIQTLLPRIWGGYCLPDSAELSADQVRDRIVPWQSKQPEVGSEPREPGDRLNEATSDYLTELLDRRIVGERVDEALLEASRAFPPVELAPLIEGASTQLNGMLSGAIRDGLATAPLPSLPVDVASGIGASFITQPLGQPIRRATITVEVIGIAVGVLLMQPQLVAACVEGIAHQVASEALSNAIDQLLTGLSGPMHQAALDQLTTAQDPIGLTARDSGPADLIPGGGTTISRDTQKLLEKARDLTKGSSIPRPDGPATDSQSDATGNAADLDDPPATGLSAMS